MRKIGNLLTAMAIAAGIMDDGKIAPNQNNNKSKKSNSEYGAQGIPNFREMKGGHRKRRSNKIHRSRMIRRKHARRK